MNLLIIGAPGAGKGTMSELIVNDYHIAHVSTGDMLRQAISEQSAVGLEAKGYMDKGELVPDKIIHDIIVDRLSKDDINKGFLFDGYPRTKNQAEDLSIILKELNLRIDKVINLEIADEVLIKRICGRRLCPDCSEIYNIYYKPSQNEGICDKCGGKLIQRSDDNPDSLKIRLQEYHKNTQPVIEYYSELGIVEGVDATKDVEKVYEDIKIILEGLQ